MSFIKRLFTAGATLAAMATLGAATAAANTIVLDRQGAPVNVGTIDFDGSTFTRFQYTYNVNLTEGSSITSVAPGSNFTIFDFNGYVQGSADFMSSAAGVGDFAISTPAFGPSYGTSTNAIGVAANDSITLLNIVATYTGSTFQQPAGASPLTIGTLVLQSVVNTIGFLDTGSQDLNINGLPALNTGTVSGPSETAGGPPVVPSPAVAGSGLLLLALAALQRGRFSGIA